MLFINADEKASWQKLHSSLLGKNILTVSDIHGFTSSGGMIEFSRKNDRITVLLNQDAINAAKLSVQSRLLKLVTVVRGG